MKSGMVRIALAALATSVALTGCGGGDSIMDTRLEQALAATPATDESTEWWGFTDVAAIEKLDGFDHVMTPYGQAAGYGYGNLAQYMRAIEKYLPSPSDAHATALAYGNPPNAVIRLTGVADIDTTYGELDGERSDFDGGTLLVRLDDFEQDLTDKTFGAPMIGVFNTIWYDGDTVVTAASQGAVKEALGDGDSLRDAEAYDGVADCLGDVVAAQLASAGFASTPGNIAIGVRDDDGTPVQVLCAKSDDAAGAAEAVEKNLKSGTDEVSLRAWSEVLKGAEVDTTDGWIRVTLTDDRAPAIFYQLLVRRGLSGLLESS